jgi:hypothetical protein
MSNITIGKIVILILFVIMVFGLVVKIDFPEGRTYDCGMAEWHPDIPNKVKEECRRLHYEEWKKQQGKLIKA